MLATILAHKRAEIEAAKSATPLGVLQERAGRCGAVRSLRLALIGPEGPRHRIVAEIKKASPSRGILRAEFDPVDLACSYVRAGAAALSVLTDEKFFQGSLSHLAKVRAQVSVPLLRKDFVLDPYQIYEARCHGADAVLLIVRVVAAELFEELLHATGEAGMEALVEVHSEEDLERALSSKVELVGINNRDLETFEADFSVTRRLIQQIPAGVTVVSASGIRTGGEIRSLESLGVNAFLIGETLVTASDPEARLRELVMCPE